MHNLANDYKTIQILLSLYIIYGFCIIYIDEKYKLPVNLVCIVQKSKLFSIVLKSNIV